MPDCLQCHKHFPNKMVIDGKTRNLFRRKYCLECSPWMAGNTRQLHLERTQNHLCTCELCGRSYEFDIHNRQGHTLKVCNSCHANRKRHDRKTQAIAYKGGKCQMPDCGYNRCEQALAFHHLNETEKDFNISGAHCKSWKVVQKELDKCILVCANCHLEIHAGIREIPENLLG